VGRKGLYSRAAAHEFEAQCGVDPGRWHCRWNNEAPGLREPVIPGRWGELYPFGHQRIGVYVCGPTAYRVKTISRKHRQWELLTDCDTEAILVAPASDLPAAAAAIRAYVRKRYRLTSADRARRVQRMLQTRGESLLAAASPCAQTKEGDSGISNRVSKAVAGRAVEDARECDSGRQNASCVVRASHVGGRWGP
jgi:hypothetical protein